ncbi:TPA: YadA-like family protein [Morganella morganii]|nr:YadA-like family protein [Morganella morganii]
MLKKCVTLISLAISSCYSVYGFADNNIAIGKGSAAVENHSVAIGTYSRATASNSVAIGLYAYTNREKTVSIGNATHKKQLIYVAEGTEDNDAVNVKQLRENKDSIISENNKKLKTVKNETINASTAYTDSAKNEAINTSAAYTNSAKNEAIDSSAAYTDAAKNEAINTSAVYTNSAKNEVISTSTQYTDTQFSRLDKKITSQVKHNAQRIDNLEKKINAGIAGVTAISSIPYVTTNNFSFGMGIGNYKNGNAVAVGAQYALYEKTNLRINTSLDNNKNSAVGAGIAIGW